MYRGSQKHVLDWTDRSTFLVELAQLLSPAPVRFSAKTMFMPQGSRAPDEARLERFGPKWSHSTEPWSDLESWWLKHTAGANTPNWDIAVGCLIEDRPGLILVEAKAHKRELKVEGKRLDGRASSNSHENHEHIGRAINEACLGWQELDASIEFSRDSHYQLANRLAFTWKLASFGFPVVLLYLGFIGDDGISNVGAPFDSDDDWQSVFFQYADGLVPLRMFDCRIEIASSPVWLLSRSRPILEVSPRDST